MKDDKKVELISSTIMTGLLLIPLMLYFFISFEKYKIVAVFILVIYTLFMILDNVYIIYTILKNRKKGGKRK